MVALVGGLGGVAGYGETTIARNDDGYQWISDISSVFESGLNFFGTTFTSLYVNTNGSISFNSGIGQYTPSTITSGLTAMIAPFWADVDTRTPANIGLESAPIYLDLDTVADVMTVTWGGVNFYSANGSLQNYFQLQLRDRGHGDFDIEFRYQDINWTTGDASSGVNGLGGTPARAGYTSGSGTNFFELPQSGDQAALLGLESTAGNTGVNGLWSFQVRNGEVMKYASDIFTQDGYLGFMAELSLAAYRLRHDVAATTTLNEAEVVGNDINNADTSTLGPSFARADYQLRLLSSSDMPTLAPVASGNSNFPVTGLADGVYTSGNAAALIGRSADALFVSFRGTNDVDSLFGDILLGSSPDSADWANKPAHYALFAALRTAITAYVNDAANGIANVYVTGHSLGGGMVHAFMTEHAADTRYHAVTFASLGFGADQADSRITNIVNVNDPTLFTSYTTGTSGDDNTMLNGMSGLFNRGTSHSMDLYYDEIQFLRSNGIDNGGITGAGGLPDYDRIYADAAATDAAQGIFTIGAGTNVLIGTAAHELFLGGDGNDYVYAGDGNDQARGGNDNDVLLGQGGNDIVNGGAGIDYVYGGTGTNTLIGGAGIDIIVIDGVNDVAYGGNDSVGAGGAGDVNYFYVNAGAVNPTVWGDGALDIYVDLSGAANVAATFHGGEGGDYFFGGGGNDVVEGDAGNDVLIGGGGADILHTGTGIDYSTGGTGNDTFIVNGTDGILLINDFVGGGTDDMVRMVGTTFTSFAQVQAALVPLASGMFLAVDADTQIWFLGLNPTSLQANDFLFA